MKTKTMIICGIFAAVICVLSVITVPIGPVPITLGLLGIMLAGVILGRKRGAIAVLVFVLLGAVGLPVYSGFKGGISVLLGPTGGYIWSYVPVTFIIGALAAREYKNKWLTMLRIFCVCLLGTAVCYVLGTAQFMTVANSDFVKAMSLCVLPFIPFDILKAAVAAFAGREIRTALTRAKLL